MILTFEDIKSSHALPIPLSHQALGEHWWYPGFGRAHPRRAGMWRVNSWFLKQKMPYGMQKLRPSCNWKVHQHTNHDHIDCDMASDVWKYPKHTCNNPLHVYCLAASGPLKVTIARWRRDHHQFRAASAPSRQPLPECPLDYHDNILTNKLITTTPNNKTFTQCVDRANYVLRNWISETYLNTQNNFGLLIHHHEQLVQ